MGTRSGELTQLTHQIRDANEQLLLSGLRQLELADQAWDHARRADDLLASQAAGVLVVDAAGNVVVINDPARRMLGIPDDVEADLARIKALDLRTRASSRIPATEHPVERLLRGEPFSDVELIMMRGDGVEVRFAFDGSVVEDGGATGMSHGLLVFHDVTAKRRLDDLRADYIGLIAHDLRAPLNAVVGYAELLRLGLDRGLGGDASEWIARVEQASRQMAGMIDDLVESTRLESGSVKLARDRVDLKALTLGAVQQLPSVQDRERIRVEVPPDELPVNADGARLSRAINNLISNALKYSPAEAPVTVLLREEVGEIILSVCDRGAGISPESIGRLFQRFYRVDPGAHTEGMGLGLYITRLIVEAHGGRIWAESEPGQGSTFSLALPLA